MWFRSGFLGRNRVLDALSEWHSCFIRCWYEYCFVNFGFWVLVWFCFSVFIIICPENECTIYSFNIMTLIQKYNAWKCRFSIIAHAVTQQQNNSKCVFFFQNLYICKFHDLAACICQYDLISVSCAFFFFVYSCLQLFCLVLWLVFSTAHCFFFVFF